MSTFPKGVDNSANIMYSKEVVMVGWAENYLAGRRIQAQTRARNGKIAKFDANDPWQGSASNRRFCKVYQSAAAYC